MLSARRTAKAFAPLDTLRAAARLTPSAPLMRTASANASASADVLRDRMSFGNASEASAAFEALRASVARVLALFQDVCPPFHGADPVGRAVTMDAALTGFVLRGGPTDGAKNPTLQRMPGERLLIEARGPTI